MIISNWFYINDNDIFNIYASVYHYDSWLELQILKKVKFKEFSFFPTKLSLWTVSF